MPHASETIAQNWHRLFGASLEMVLAPVNITVLTNFPVMTNPPETDILLLRNNEDHWTAEQRDRLADGIRDTIAAHILIEFKYTESLTERVLQKALGYDIFYKESKGPHGNNFTFQG